MATSTISQPETKPPVEKKRLGAILLARGLVSESQLEGAIRHQQDEGNKQLLGEVLVAKGFATEEQVVEALAEAYEVPFAHVNPRLVDTSVLEVLPRQFIEQQCVLPLFVVNGVLTVAVPEPANVFLIEEIQRISNLKVQVVAATAHDIQQTMHAQLPNTNVFVIDQIVEDMQPQDMSVVEQEVTELTDLEEVAGRSPVIKLVNFLIFSAVQEGASDIHIEPEEQRLRVRFRLDGRLFEKICPPAQMHPAVVSRLKIMAGLDISERRTPQDGGIHVLMEGRPIDLRVSCMPGQHGEKVVIRVIDNRATLVSLDKLGLGFEMRQRFESVLHQPNGIILVTGPTGSGKSTTLYAMLSELNDDEVNLSTVEDPVELSLPGVNQFQVNEKANFTFATALRSLLRQDPDILMVGEVRDAETAKIATQAALTGHVVLSTLHTNDAPSAVTRMQNMGVEPFLIAASLRGVLAQRLVRKICKTCKEPMELPAPVRAALGDLIADDEVFYHGTGCSKCRQTGFSGRIGLFELLTPGDQMLDLIARGGGLHEVRAMALEGDYVSLRSDGLDKARAGMTTIDEVLYVTSV